MQAADEKLIIIELGSYGTWPYKQSGRSGFGLSNFMPTEHAHEHFDFIMQVDIKTI